jgi:hypothetical protein
MIEQDIRYYKGKIKVQVLTKGKRNGRKGPLTWRVRMLAEGIIPLLEKADYVEIQDGQTHRGYSLNQCCVGSEFVTVPRLLWRNKRVSGKVTK